MRRVYIFRYTHPSSLVSLSPPKLATTMADSLFRKDIIWGTTASRSPVEGGNKAVDTMHVIDETGAEHHALYGRRGGQARTSRDAKMGGIDASSVAGGTGGRHGGGGATLGAPQDGQTSLSLCLLCCGRAYVGDSVPSRLSTISSC